MLKFENEYGKIYCGDNVKLMKEFIEDESIDLTVTSPPYDELRDYNGYYFDFENVAKELFRITKQGGVVVWVVADSAKNSNESGTSLSQALFFKEIGFNLFDTMIYAKPPRGAIGNNKGYWQTFEFMFVFSKGEPKTINLICDRENSSIRGVSGRSKRLRSGNLVMETYKGNSKFGRRTNIWEYNTGFGNSAMEQYSFEHPAIFPEKLAEDHIISWSNEGDTVFDPFLGSGTTSKMSMMKYRKFIGIDCSEEYIEIAIKRIKNKFDI
jgi:site-specific DNA-methyltransferase (adenine-specific)